MIILPYIAIYVKFCFLLWFILNIILINITIKFTHFLLSFQIILLKLSNNIDNPISKITEHTQSCKHNQITQQYFRWISRSHITITHPCGRLNRPIKSIIIPNRPFKYLNQIHIKSCLRSCQPKKTSIIIFTFLQIIVVIDSKINASAKTSD